MHRLATNALSAVLAAILALNPALAHAADAPASAATAPHLAITPVSEGAAAPYSGVLLDADTFKLYLRGQVALEEANMRIQFRDKMLQDAAEKAQRSWWERNGFWVGAGVGFIASVFVVWEVRQVLSPPK